jgi:hypothetical protein
VKTSRRGASGIDLLAGVNTFEKTGSTYFSSDGLLLFRGAFSLSRRLEDGTVSLTESIALGVVNGVLCCSESMKGVIYKY